MDRPSPRITYDNPIITVDIHDNKVRITMSDGDTGRYLSDDSLVPSEARRMGQALIDFANQIDGQEK